MIGAPGRTPCDPSAGVMVSVGAGVDAAPAAEQPMAASAASDTSIANAITLRWPADLNFLWRTAARLLPPIASPPRRQIPRQVLGMRRLAQPLPTAAETIRLVLHSITEDHRDQAGIVTTCCAAPGWP